MPKRMLVTGGLGFIGSEFVRRAAARGVEVVNVDLGTYAGDERRLAGVEGVETISMDVADPALGDVVAAAAPEAVVHFAAETHVTRSETDPEAFYRSNVDGTRNLLDGAVAAGAGMIVHVSTDEVYGPCEGDPFVEDDKLPGEGAATSAYARSKALADDVARSYFTRAPVAVVRPTNCFGSWQHPEKAIPRWIVRALAGDRLPVWGDGAQVRDWMAVEDACSAIELLVDRRAAGDVYNVAPEGAQRSNLEMARAIARAAGRPDDAVYLTAYDRPQHDRRYAVDAAKLRALGWAPGTDVEAKVAQTLDWYRTNRPWWETLVADAESLYADAAERGDKT
jgi:dTDP-glucose 4,6-dehydratase